MGREVRMVPPDWQHPSKIMHGSLRYVALYEGCDLADRISGWDAEAVKWAAGEFPSYAGEDSKKLSYSEWAGERPDPADYMPNWADAERTHFMMYEDTSEGTPISPAFATPEELARWLADTGASSFGNSTASYETWLAICKGGWAPDLVVNQDGVKTGIELLGKEL